MEKVSISDFVVNGIFVRTSNNAEMNEDTAKIGKLWQDFFTILTKQGEMPPVAYGVYSNYESDWQGGYDVLAGIEGELVTDKSVSLSIPNGSYLCFTKKGEMPGAALELWQEIWEYFSQSDTPMRAYQYDFEKYLGLDTVEIYIGIVEREL